DRKWDERFAAMDSDHNGQLSLAEFKAARGHGPEGRRGGPDADSRGFEGRRFGGRGFGRKAGHFDGTPSHGGPGGARPGPEAGVQGGPDGGPAAKPVDVTREMFMRRALTRFDLLDSNDDGKITAAERDAVRAFRGPGHGGGPARPDGKPPR
ncbi:MAG: EF-hand domain-containing protein, partial [Sphingobium sp.]